MAVTLSFANLSLASQTPLKWYSWEKWWVFALSWTILPNDTGLSAVSPVPKVSLSFPSLAALCWGQLRVSRVFNHRVVFNGISHCGHVLLKPTNYYIESGLWCRTAYTVTTCFRNHLYPHFNLVSHSLDFFIVLDSSNELYCLPHVGSFHNGSTCFLIYPLLSFTL